MGLVELLCFFSVAAESRVGLAETHIGITESSRVALDLFWSIGDTVPIDTSRAELRIEHPVFKLTPGIGLASCLLMREQKC